MPRGVCARARARGYREQHTARAKVPLRFCVHRSERARLLEWERAANVCQNTHARAASCFLFIQSEILERLRRDAFFLLQERVSPHSRRWRRALARRTAAQLRVVKSVAREYVDQTIFFARVRLYTRDLLPSLAVGVIQRRVQRFLRHRRALAMRVASKLRRSAQVRHFYSQHPRRFVRESEICIPTSALSKRHVVEKEEKTLFPPSRFSLSLSLRREKHTHTRERERERKRVAPSPRARVDVRRTTLRGEIALSLSLCDATESRRHSPGLTSSSSVWEKHRASKASAMATISQHADGAAAAPASPSRSWNSVEFQKSGRDESRDL